MSKYTCNICGFEFDEALGDPARGIAPGTRWADVPDTWVCPVCGADKSMFVQVGGEAAQPAAAPEMKAEGAADGSNPLALSALCSNLARGCAKQYRAEEAALFTQLADWYQAQSVPQGNLESIVALLKEDLDIAYPAAFAAAGEVKDRGALRALTWGEKVSKIQFGLAQKYQKQGEKALEGKVFVCEACGFIYVGDAPPDICPVCKVPPFKFNEVKRGA